MENLRSPSDQLIRKLQWIWMIGFIVLVLGIISWFIHLMRTALWLGDVPSAAIGIPLVAIPIFLALASVVFYVFWGLAIRGRDR
ncbi:MAG: hypothetical protein Q8S00_10925 [Deltaproteobacteria bacterium]|nr:hypothetical protein [Deltaproteobacteria bacterium]MDZ4342068.1 hypothetical protein [Candidatus Binatia bacterium]